MRPHGGVSTRHLVGPGPQDPRRLLAFVAVHAVPGVEHWDGVTYGRTLDLPGGPAVAKVRVREDGYAVTVQAADPADVPTAFRRLRHLLALDVDVTRAEALLRSDPVLGPVVSARSGLRPPGSVDHAETLIRTIIGQQVSLSGARALCGRLVAAHGTPLPQDLQAHGLTHLWPRPGVLAALHPDDDALAMPATRARALITAATALCGADGGLPASADLLALPGIGPWTTRYVDLRCRADPDVFLAGDLAALRALDRLGAPREPRAAADLATRWTPYRSLALLHLWASYLNL